MGRLYRSPRDESTLRQWCAAALGAWTTPHTTSELETVLGRTHLTAAGEGPGTVVYLPGTNFNAATSTGLLTLLAARWRVVCADLPGQPGLSSARRPRDEDATDHWIAEVVDSCRRPGDRVVLMGHSRGAALALAARPQLVDSLVLLSPAGLAPVRLTRALVTRSTAWLVRPTEQRSAGLLDLMAGGEPVADLDLLVEWMTLVARTTRTSGAPGPLPGAQLDRWRGRDVRVLVGERDVFFPPDRLRDPMADHLGVPLQVVAGAGHLLVDQRPDAVAAAVADGRAA